MLVCVWDGAMRNPHEELRSEGLDGDCLVDFDEYVWYSDITV